MPDELIPAISDRPIVFNDLVADRLIWICSENFGSFGICLELKTFLGKQPAGPCIAKLPKCCEPGTAQESVFISRREPSQFLRDLLGAAIIAAACLQPVKVVDSLHKHDIWASVQRRRDRNCVRVFSPKKGQLADEINDL